MSNKKICLGILAIMLVLEMTVVGCGDGGGDSGGGGEGGGGLGPSFLGETLTLSGQIWEGLASNENGPVYKQLTRNKTIIEAGFSIYDYDGERFINIGGSGSITNGQFSFSIDTPSELVSIREAFDEVEDLYNNFNISPSNTMCVELDRLKVTGDGYTSMISPIWGNNNASEDVTYYFVDRDVIITGKGKITTSECHCEEWGDGLCHCEEWDGKCYCGWPNITRDLKLELKAGWNAVTLKKEWGNSDAWTKTISAGNSTRVRWVIVIEWQDY